MHNSSHNNEPLVSVMMPTYNRQRYLGGAIESALSQDYDNFEVIVVRDGGSDVSDIVSRFNDPRLVFIDRDYNKGKAYSLNEGLQRARGKYICYLDDDDEFYPHHIKTLVNVLEDGEKYQVAYSDLYKAHCRVAADGTRTILSKNVEVSRDFDRMFVLHYNLALHVSVMHRRDLLDKIGLYNEELKILIDWDFTRRAAFFADFKHIHTITGQFFGPVGQCDRISVQQRKDSAEYLKNVLTIKTTRPAKPWDKLKDVSVVLLGDTVNETLGKTIRDIWLQSFYPYKLHIPLSAEQFGRLNTQMPVAMKHIVPTGISAAAKVDAIINQCDGDYIAIVQSGYPIKESWVERGINALANNSGANEAIELEDASDICWAAVMPKQILINARLAYPQLDIKQSLIANGTVVRKVDTSEYCFQFDNYLYAAKEAQSDGNWEKAAHIYKYMENNFGNELWMKTMCAYALYRGGHHSNAMEIISQVNETRPTVSTLLLQGRIYREQNNFNAAIDSFNSAKGIIQGKTAIWTQ